VCALLVSQQRRGSSFAGKRRGPSYQNVKS
jgi:hypothetical protein